MPSFRLAVVGNPNCGKTTLFNRLTGEKHTVGNWAGVTLDRASGRLKTDAAEIELVDLPGTYTLSCAEDSCSLDEKAAQEFMLSEEVDGVINVLDGANLHRSLYLTLELLETGKPVFLVVNRSDLAESTGKTIHFDYLTQVTGSPSMGVVALKNQGLEALTHSLVDWVSKHEVHQDCVRYSERLEQCVSQLSVAMEMVATERKVSPRWLAIRALEQDALVRAWLSDELMAERDATEQRLADDAEMLLADERYGLIDTWMERLLTQVENAGSSWTERFDRVVLNPYLGVPFFLFVMYLMFTFAMGVGGAFIDFFDILASTIFIDGVRYALESVNAPEWLSMVLADGIGGGIQVVMTFIPIIAALYIFMSVLESSGYMARAAFVTDRFMTRLDLPGKSFVPLVIGLGCNVPAVMATRTLENPKDRVVVSMMVPFMSCGARLPVYALIVAAFFSESASHIVLLLYVIGIVMAMFTAWILKRTVLNSPVQATVMELPLYHLPSVSYVWSAMSRRVGDFVKGAGKLIVTVVLAINVLNSMGTDGSFGNQDSQNSVLAEAGRAMTPVFEPMGIDEHNWPATVGLLTGLLAKEVVVGSLSAIYATQQSNPAISESEEVEYSLIGGLRDAVHSLPDPVVTVMDTVGDPLGMGILDSRDLSEAAAIQEVRQSLFEQVKAEFHGKAEAFAYLLFVLLYMPCVAVLGALYREIGLRWMVFSGVWTTGLAYFTATGFYQIATFAAHPMSSIVWIGFAIAFPVIVYQYLKRQTWQ